MLVDFSSTTLLKLNIISAWSQVIHGRRVKEDNFAFLAKVFELRIKYKDGVVDIKPLKMDVLILQSIPVTVFTHLSGHIFLLSDFELSGQAG